MAVEVRIPTILRTYTGGEKAVQGDGDTLQQVIDDLESRHPASRSGWSRTADLRRFVNVYVNDEDVRFTGGLGPRPPTVTWSSCCRPSPAAERPPRDALRLAADSVGGTPLVGPAAAVAVAPTCGCGPSWRTATRPARSRTGRR